MATADRAQMPSEWTDSPRGKQVPGQPHTGDGTKKLLPTNIPAPGRHSIAALRTRPARRRFRAIPAHGMPRSTSGCTTTGRRSGPRRRQRQRRTPMVITIRVNNDAHCDLPSRTMRYTTMPSIGKPSLRRHRPFPAGATSHRNRGPSRRRPGRASQAPGRRRLLGDLTRPKHRRVRDIFGSSS